MEKRKHHISHTTIHCNNCEELVKNGKTGNSSKKTGRQTTSNIDMHIESPTPKAMMKTLQSVTEKVVNRQWVTSLSSILELCEDTQSLGSTTQPLLRTNPRKL
jgi:hypothetical protein